MRSRPLGGAGVKKTGIGKSASQSASSILSRATERTVGLPWKPGNAEEQRRLEDLQAKLPELQNALEELRTLKKQLAVAVGNAKRAGTRQDRAQVLEARLGLVENAEVREVEWTIPDYSSLLENCPKGQCIVSAPFCAAGVPNMQLIFHPNGNRDAREGYCSIALRTPGGTSLSRVLYVNQDSFGPSITKQSVEGYNDASLISAPSAAIRGTAADIIVVGVRDLCQLGVMADPMLQKTLIIGDAPMAEINFELLRELREREQEKEQQMLQDRRAQEEERLRLEKQERERHIAEEQQRKAAEDAAQLSEALKSMSAPVDAAQVMMQAAVKTVADRAQAEAAKVETPEEREEREKKEKAYAWLVEYQQKQKEAKAEEERQRQERLQAEREVREEAERQLQEELKQRKLEAKREKAEAAKRAKLEKKDMASRVERERAEAAEAIKRYEADRAAAKVAAAAEAEANAALDAEAAEVEEQRRRLEEEKQQELVARRAAELREKRLRDEEERRQAEEDARRIEAELKKQEEEDRRREAERQRQMEEQRRRREEEALQAEAEQRQKEEQRRLELEQGRKRQEQLRRLEEQRRAFERAEEERDAKLKEQQRREAEAAERRRQEEERRQAEEQARLEAEARERAEAEARERAAEEERQRKEAEVIEASNRGRGVSGSGVVASRALRRTRESSVGSGYSDVRDLHPSASSSPQPENTRRPGFGAGRPPMLPSSGQKNLPDEDGSDEDEPEEVFQMANFKPMRANMGPASGSNLRAWALAAAKPHSDDEDSGDEELDWVAQRQMLRGQPSALPSMVPSASLPSMRPDKPSRKSPAASDDDSGSDAEPVFFRR
eukprot:TRINITY_DN3664_c0_g1_i1.p1 TRINITY_DN3664_c0_g1~~TRINITY_DN3664_c0_g1_i1.p1  ORF type:complete len:841 (+),score=283.48 TRINITY_DN3664_c0_g1_i1:87-2609(+)